MRLKSRALVGAVCPGRTNTAPRDSWHGEKELPKVLKALKNIFNVFKNEDRPLVKLCEVIVHFER